jgi:DNA topoisomerase-2
MTESTDNEQYLINTYQHKTDIQHILDAPDTYLGSVERLDDNIWVFDETTSKVVQKNISYIPGLYKLFDEGIVNCRDHAVRMQQKQDKGIPNIIPVSYIDISIDETDGTITMTNDGNGIDVAMHPTLNIWIPELIFGHLRTSTNYNKNEKKIVGGKNGFGFKLVLIWSVEGTIETVDHTRGLKYIQTFKNNLTEIGIPIITKTTLKKPYTKVSFKPDYQRLGLPCVKPLSADMISLLTRRVNDIAALTDKNLKVKYNGAFLSVKHFQQYVDTYIGDKETAPRIYEASENGRWEYVVALSPFHEFTSVSFVNGISTQKGGKHVEYILNQITRKMSDYIEKKKKIKVNNNTIKEQLFLFLRCDIENPAFDSQTKDHLNTPISKFGSSCDVSEKFIEKLAKIGVMDAACELTEVKENNAAAKKTDGAKTKKIRGIPKLDDANMAGTDKSAECVLILCEGDSAKSGVISGLSSQDRNYFGVYPMKGKMMNVRGETVSKISDNKEITEIKKILGLENGKKYSTLNDVHKFLRYGKVIFLTDADLDGSHIKGLIINFFQTQWPSLTLIPGFIGFMNTPILKAKKGGQLLSFYNDGEYKLWKSGILATDLNKWEINYYKGLGTSSKTEFCEYFKNKKIVGFLHKGTTSDDAIDMAFNKKRPDDRKLWLGGYNREHYLNTSDNTVSYEDFVNKELIHFSKYDCDRSIPNLMDGLKISLRKILFSAFKKRLQSKIKVAQFSGYVSEHSAYHHGEASLNAAIVGMAQNFVGSNNINLLVPSGQFGTRLKGGSDSSSERYIYTMLSSLTRLIYPENDDSILKYLDDDGQIVEPVYYAPIIPMILVNGSKGIGTGFSTEILSYNPLDIIDYLNDILLGMYDSKNISSSGDISKIEFIPYYEGFKGTIEKHPDLPNKFIVQGLYEKLGEDQIRITELPVGIWTEDYKEFLEALLGSSDKNGKKTTTFIKDYDDLNDDSNINIVITFQKGKLDEMEASGELKKSLKLTTTMTTTNMHLFNAQEKLTKYECVVDIIQDYYETRLVLYEKRRENMILELKKNLVILQNKVQYIQEVLEATIDLRKKSKEDVFALLKSKKYDLEQESYLYLTKMPMDSVTSENVLRLNKEHNISEAKLKEITETSARQMWCSELKTLRQEYLVYREERRRLLNDTIFDENNTTKKKKISVKKNPISSR